MKSKKALQHSLSWASYASIAICAITVSSCFDSSSPNPFPSYSPVPPSNGASTGSGGITRSTGVGAQSVLMQHNDSFRTGQNLEETILNRGNVNPTSFGKIAALPVDGEVYGQPLVAAGVTLSDGSVHDVLYAVTENDSVYAYDSDTLSTTPIWQRSMLGDSEYTCPNAPCSVLTPIDTGAPNVSPKIGITSTPVIDPDAGVIYLVASLKDSQGNIYLMLHGLSLSTGQEMQGSPVTIQPSEAGSGAGSSNGTVTFNPKYQLQRAGLAYDNGLVYVAMTSWNDQEPTHGWLIAYNSATLAQVSAYLTTPNSGDGTIWQAGGGVAIDDSNNVYFATGNGDPNYVTSSNRDLSDSVLKLSFGSSGLSLSDYFTPANYAALASGDVDVGSGGVLLLPEQSGPNPNLMIAGGKQGTIYVLNRNSLGQFNSSSTTTDTQIVQEIPNQANGGVLPGGTNYGPGIYGTPAYFNGSVFWGAAGDALREIPLSNGTLNTAAMSVSPISIALRGASPSISASGSLDGIVWYTDASAYTYSWTEGTIPPTESNGPAVLYAFSTDNLATPLYASGPPPVANSHDIPNPPAGTVSTAAYVGPSADSAGYAVKYSVPTVVNGMVFVGTQTEVSVYGLRSSVAANVKKDANREIASATTTTPSATPRIQPFDWWTLTSPYQACSYHPGTEKTIDSYSSSMY